MQSHLTLLPPHSENYSQPRDLYSKDVSWAVAIRSYFLDKQRIETQYFSPTGAVLGNAEVHYKEKSLNTSDRKSGLTLQEVLVAEKVALASIRTISQDVTEMTRIRRQEESAYADRDDTKCNRFEACNGANPYTDEEGSSKGSASEQSHADYLSPFLLLVKDPNNIAVSEADVQVRDACLKTLKERLLERANIMQARLNEENAKLSQAQDEYQQGKIPQEQFEQLCSDVTFRIKILERRLSEHEDSAIAKYKALKKRLDADERLAVLHG